MFHGILLCARWRRRVVSKSFPHRSNDDDEYNVLYILQLNVHVDMSQWQQLTALVD